MPSAADSTLPPAFPSLAEAAANYPAKPYVFRVRVPVTKARPLRHYLASKFPVVLTDECRWRLLWRVFTVEAPPEQMPQLRKKVERRVGDWAIFSDR